MVRKGKTVVRCGRCALLAREPMPAVADLLTWYRDEYWTQYAGEQRGAARDNLYRHVLDCLSRRLPEPGTLVDVGCGMGALLTQARQRGWRGIGFDPSPSAVAEARAQGLEAYELAWPPCGVPDASVNAVVFLNVLDHLLTPFAALEEARRVLRPRGWVYVRVPNAPLHVAWSRVLSLVGVDDVTIMHLYGFGRRALRHHLTRLGFENVMIRTAPPSQHDAYRCATSSRWTSRSFLKYLDGAAYRASTSVGVDRLGWGPSIEAMASKGPATS
jgi:SAM-dependent methyltransferase